jgi:HSP20 family protein
MREPSWFEEINRMQEDFDRLISRFFSPRPSRDMLPDYSQTALEEPSIRNPLTDIIEKDNEIIVKVEMPGINKDDIEINATEDGIEIKGETSEKVEKGDKKKGWQRIERRYSGFQRFISLPDGADIEKIDASYKNGILELDIPKKESKKKKSKKIKVK